jgi:hypothetical protein
MIASAAAARPTAPVAAMREVRFLFMEDRLVRKSMD